MNIEAIHAVLVHRLSLMTYTSYLPCQYPSILLTRSQEICGTTAQPFPQPNDPVQSPLVSLLSSLIWLLQTSILFCVCTKWSLGVASGRGSPLFLCNFCDVPVLLHSLSNHNSRNTATMLAPVSPYTVFVLHWWSQPHLYDSTGLVFTPFIFSHSFFY